MNMKAYEIYDKFANAEKSIADGNASDAKEFFNSIREKYGLLIIKFSFTCIFVKKINKKINLYQYQNTYAEKYVIM